MTLNPTDVDSEQALQKILQKLAIATELYRHHGDGGRIGAWFAVRDTISYFADLGIPRATLKPLEAIAAAMHDAERGRISPIFEPVRTAGKPPTSIEQLQFEGCLATVTECCIVYRQAEGARPYIESGCRLAASLIRASWGREYTFTQLREVRERVQQNRNRLSPDRLLLDKMRASADAKLHPLDWAKLLLASNLTAPPPSNSV